jgi:hypothetical protein
MLIRWRGTAPFEDEDVCWSMMYVLNFDMIGCRYRKNIGLLSVVTLWNVLISFLYNQRLLSKTDSLWWNISSYICRLSCVRFCIIKQTFFSPTNLCIHTVFFFVRIDRGAVWTLRGTKRRFTYEYICYSFVK